MSQAADAVAYLHLNGVVPRDLKPEITLEQTWKSYTSRLWPDSRVHHTKTS